MRAKGARRSMGAKSAQRKFLSTLHPNTIHEPNPAPNTHPSPKPTLTLPLTLTLTLALTLALNLGSGRGGGGDSRKSDIMLKTPPEPNLKKGGFWGGGLRGFFAARGYCPRKGHPGPPNPPPMKNIVSGTSEQLRGAKSEVAHKWARWLHHPCRLGDPHRFRAGGKIRSGPQVGKVATSPLPPLGSPPLQSGGQNQKCPKKGGNATSPLHYGGSLAKGTKSKVAELGARTKLWMCSPKEYHQNKIRTNDVSASKNTLKTPPRTIFKKGGVFSKPPTLSDFSEPPPPWLRS